MSKTLEERVSELEKIIYGEQEVTVPYIDFYGDDEIVSLPKRNKSGDIGYDAFARETVIVPAHGSAKVPLGIGAIVPDGFSIAARTRGGRWLNGLLVGDAHVDWNYRGEINALLYNVTDNEVSWISNGIEYYITSDVLTQDEMIEIAKSVGLLAVSK